MKLTKRLLSTLLVLCMVLSMLPAMGLTASAATATVAEGDFVIAVQIGDTYYALPNNPTKWQTTITGAEITVNSDGTVTAENASGYTWTLKKSNSKTGYYNIYFVDGTTTKYLSRNGTSTSNVNLNVPTKLGASGQSDWLFTLSDNNTTYLVASGTSNVMYLSADSNHVFGSYNKTNATGSSYYRIQLLPIGSGTITTAALTGITLDTTSVQTTFTVGDTFNSTGLVVTAAYDDNSTKQVTPTSVSAPDMTTAGTKTITVSYTENGVTVTADYTITVNEPTTYTVTYHSAGSVYGTATVVEGNAIGADKLPTPTVDGWTFIGWSTTEILTAQDNRPALYAGTEAVTGNLDLYAVYAKENTSESAGYKLVDTPTAGKTYLVVTSDAAGTAYALDASALTTTSAKTVTATAVTITENGSDKYISTTDANLLWTFSGTVSSAQFRSSNADGYYLKINGSGFAGSSTSTDVYWSTSYGLYGKSGSGSTSYYVKPSGTDSLSANTTSGSVTSRVYLYEGGAAVAAYSNYTTNPGTMYTITWMVNGTEYQKDTVAENSAVTAPAVDPTMDDTAANYFDFAGWSASNGGAVLTSFPNATENATYYAVFTTHAFTTVNWVVEGTTVATESYRAGETPSYKGETPTKASDDTYSYTFSGWNPEITAVSEEGVTITYTAVFTATEITYAASLSIGSSTLKVTKTRTATSTLTRDGVEITGVTPAYSSSNTAVATINASTGLITALTVGTTDITVTYTVGGKDYTATQTLTVVENTSMGGYTLMTQANSPTDWSGEYIFIGRAGGKLYQLNDLWIMTPKWSEDGTAIVEENGSAAANNASHIDGLTITDGEAIGTINSAYTTGDEISMVATGDNDFTISGTDYTVLDQITEIPDGYAFEIELVDDVSMYYTIRVKGTSYYLANTNTAGAGDNGFNYTMVLTEGDLAPLWTIRWATADDGLTSTAEGYTPNQVMIESVYSSAANTGLTSPIYNRDILYNPMQAEATSFSRFRVYGEVAYHDNGNLGGSSNNGATYNLFLYGNPNPFNAQISYNGDQVTLTQHAEVQVGVPSITLDGALTPDIATEPNWSLVSGPTWSIVSTSTSGTMAIDANTGAMTFSGVSADDYAIVGLSYVVHDDINNVDHTVSTQGMVVIIPTSDTYTGIAFEQASGKETETSYTVKYTVNQLPLDFYVKSDSDLTTVYNDGRTSTGTYAIDNSGMTWSVAISSGGSGATASIANDGDGSATLNMSGFTEDAILTVTVSGVVANGKTVPAFTYKVYVKYVAYTVAITHDGGTTGNFSVSASTTSVPLGKTVTNAAGETPADSTFTTSGGTWAIVGNANGATIDSATGVLDLSGCDRSEEFTLQVIVSGVSATTTPSDGSDPVTTTGLYDTVTITVQAQSVDFRINDDTLVLDYDRSVTFDVLANDNLNGLTVSSLTVTDSNVTVNANKTLTYTPSGWLAGTVSFTYTVTLSNGGSGSATVNIVPAESVYYEDSNSVFTYTNGQRGEWTTEGTETVQAQTSSLTSSDIYGYDTNYDSASCAKYSAGSIHKVNVSANHNFSYPDRDPYVTFTFVGTGFDVICLNSNETGAVMVRVLNNDTGKYVVSKVIDTFRGYNYSAEAVEVVGYTEYARYMKNADGTYTAWDGSADPTEYVYILHDGVTDTTSDSSFTKKALTDFYTKNADGTYTQDNSGTYVKHVTTTNWVINTGLTGDTSAMYQVPLIRETGLGYGNYTVTVTAVYNAAFDYTAAGDYDMYFDAVRIYDPVNQGSEYTYHSIRDELIEDDAFGDGSATPCTHETLGGWEFNTKATYTSSATTNGRGSFVKRCTNCGKICETDYFYVTATADNTELDSQEANGLPATTTLRYTITSDNAEVQAILNALTFDEYWRSSNEAVFTCKNFGSSVRANGAGTTYATLQLTVGTGDARVTYASAIHTPDITVTGCTHAWTTKTTAATCQAEGTTTYTCSLCGYSYSATLPVVDHSYTYQHNETQHWGACIWCGTTTTAENHNFTAEVTETGITYTCNVCGYSYTQSTTCSHANTYLSGYLAATCTTAGYTGDTKCSDCGETIAYGKTIPATGHSYGDWTHNDATAEASSTHSKTCANCSDVVTEACSFTDVVTPPTTTSQGYTTHTCDLCGYSYKDNYTDPTSTYTVTYYVNGSVVDSLTQSNIEDGTAVTLAAAQSVSGYRYDYKFLGWAAAPMDADSATAPTVYAAGENYTVSQNTGFHAVYSYMGSDAGNTYEPVTTAPSDWSGNYVIVNSGLTNALAPTQAKTGEFDAVAVTVTDNKVVDPASDIVWTFVSNGNGAYYIYNSNGYLQISGTSSTSAALTTTAKDSFTIESSSTTGVWKVASTTNTARCFSYYASNQSFRTYAKNTNNTGYLFKATGTTYYATSLQAPCTHTNTTIETEEATCTTAGYAKEVCNDCGAVVDYVNVDALGHSYGSATNTGDAAMHTYTCSRCGDSYTEDHSFNPSVSGDTTTYTCTLCGYSYAETASYTLTYVVPTTQTAPAAATGTSATLPSMSNYNSGTTAYTFVGWVATPTSATTTEPTLYAANSTYSFSADTKLYACYSYDVTSGGGSSNDYTLFTGSITEGDYIIVYNYNGDGAMTATVSSSRLTYTDVTVVNDTVSNPDASVIWHIAPTGDGYYTIYNEKTASYAAGTGTKSQAKLVTTVTDYAKWTPSGTSTYEFVNLGNKNGGVNANLRRNQNYGFACYSTSTGGALSLYKASTTGGSGTTTTYYTTDDAASTTTVTYTVGLVADTTKVEVGGTAYLTATLYADGVAVDGTVPVWTNSQSSVATIETAGEICTVTGVASGTTQVRATFTCPDGSTKYSYKTITVGSTSTSSPSSAEEVNYVTSGSYIYNWGTRGTTATFLTTYATDYYTGSYSYDTLSALSGTTSTSASDIYSSALGQAIHSMLDAKQTTTTSYDATRYLFCYTDCEESNTSKISSYYSGTEVTSEWDKGATWNREHTWPNSKGAGGNDENDIMMLRPTSVNENSSRSNTAYGESSGYYDPNSVSNGTLNLHGDVARLMLQHMMCWGNTSYMFGSSGVMESRAVLLKWMEEDPVDTWEMGRNDAVQAITGVRNVFVDYPELGFLLLGAEVPAGYTTPSGNAASTAGTASAASTVEVAERSATRATGAANYSGAAFLDGIGNTSSVEEMNKYGPKNEVYLANGQAIVFYLVGDKAVEHLQIGAKAANGTAHIKITALNSPDTVVLDKELVTATEMYYEFGSGISWSSGVSSAIVIENTGSGILSITNLRYLTAEGSLAFYVNSSAVAQSRLLLATGSSVPETEPELPGDDITPTDPTSPSDEPIESSDSETPTEAETPTDPEPAEPETPADPEPAAPEVKIEQFKDVSESDWFYDGVKYAVESGLMKGVSEEDFAPDETLTRAMLVTILYRLAGAPAVDENAKLAFTDVEDGQWYTDAIIWATEEGITHGMTETTFGTDEPVTREQMVTFLWRYVGEPESEQSLESFPDADQISAFAETAMRWAVENEIITGNEMNGNAYIDPQGNATRAQVAVIFMRSEKTLD